MGAHGDALRVRLTAPPVDGAANEALVRFLAERLGVPQERGTAGGRRDGTDQGGEAWKDSALRRRGRDFCEPEPLPGVGITIGYWCSRQLLPWRFALIAATLNNLLKRCP